MYELLQEKRNQRATLHEEAKAILVKAKAESRDLTGEETSKVDAIYADVDKLKNEMERLERSAAEERALEALAEAEARNKHQRKTSPPGRPPGDDFRGMLMGATELPEIPVFVPENLRAVALSNLAGAIDPMVIAKFEEALKFFGPMWQVATITRTDTGASLYMPTINDTGNAGTILAEAGTVTTADPTFGSVVFGAYKVESKQVLISNETIQDSSIPLEPIVGRLLGERIARGSNTMFTTKTNGPTGIATTQCGAVSGKTAAATNAFTLPEIIDLVHSIDPWYRSMSSFMLHDNIIAATRKLVDSQNRPLWEPSIQAGQPDRLYGYPVFTNNDMATNLATGNKIIIFGALGKYQIRVAGGLRTVVARELYSANDQTALFGFLRVDGNLLDAGTDPVKWLNLA